MDWFRGDPDSGNEQEQRPQLLITLPLGLALAALTYVGVIAFNGGNTGVLRIALPQIEHMQPAPHRQSTAPNSGDAAAVQPTDLATPSANSIGPGGAQLADSSQRPAAARGTVRPVTFGTGEYLPIAFDLAMPDKGDERVGDAIVTRKAVRFKGREIGSVPIRVENGSRLTIGGDDLAKLMSKAGLELPTQVAADKGSIPLAELRQQGIDLRYEPNSDTLSLTPR